MGTRFSDARALALRLLVVFFVLVACFVVSLTLVYAIPRAPIAEHVRESARLVAAEGLYPHPFIEHPALRLDNYTDALMLDVALGTPGRSPLRQALESIRGDVREANGDESPIRSLVEAAAGPRSAELSYARYWHGYQVLLRPALYLFTYAEIRYLNLLALVAVIAVAYSMCLTRLGHLTANALLGALLLAGVYVVPMSLQFSSTVYLSLLAVIAVAWRISDGSRSRSTVLFFAVGMLTAFFDVLTAPVLTLGLPLVAVLITRSLGPEERTIGHEAGFFAQMCAVWGLGYAAAWSTKWLLGSWVLGTNVLLDATSKAGYWVRSPLWAAAKAVRLNLSNLLPTARFDPQVAGVMRYILIGPTGVLLAIAIIAWVVMFVLAARPRSEIVRAVPVLFVVPLPYVWYAVTNAHAAIHYSFTYRAQAAALFALLYFTGACIDTRRLLRRVTRTEVAR